MEILGAAGIGIAADAAAVAGRTLFVADALPDGCGVEKTGG
jgi:hypothetical protein